MVRRIITTAVFDLLALAFLYFVMQDLAWRNSYAEGEHLTPSTTYSLFIRTFSIKGGTLQVPKLTSPPALDWVQVVIALLLVVNGLYIFSRFRRSPKRQERASLDASPRCSDSACPPCSDCIHFQSALLPRVKVLP